MYTDLPVHSCILISVFAVFHWRSSHYAVTQVRNKNSNIQGRSPNVLKVMFKTIFFFKRISFDVRNFSTSVCHLENGIDILPDY